MMPTDENHQGSDKSDPIADDAEIYRRFREAMDLFTRGMVAKAKAMMTKLENNEPGSLEVRDASAVVIATQRIMEMKDSYEQKVRSAGGAAAAGEARRLADQFNAIARDVGLIGPQDTIATRAQSNALRDAKESA